MGGMRIIGVAELYWAVVRAQIDDEPARSMQNLAGKAQRRRSAFFEEYRVAQAFIL